MITLLKLLEDDQSARQSDRQSDRQSGRRSDRRPWVMVNAVVGGALGAGLVAVVNEVSASDLDSSSLLFGILFLAVLAVMHLCERRAARVMVDIFEEVQSRLRTELSERLRVAPLRAVEALGAVESRVINDLSFISNCLPQFVTAVQDSAFLIAMTLAIALVSTKGLAIWLVTCSAIALYQRQGLARIQTLQERVSASSELLHEELDEILDGFAQLKLDQHARQTLMDDMKRATGLHYAARDEAENTGIRSALIGIFLFFLLGFGTAVFGTADFVDLGPEVGYELCILLAFSLGPLLGLLEALPVLTRAEASASAVVAVLEQLAAADHEQSGVAGATLRSEIEVTGLEFAYRGRDDGSGFAVGPIDLTLRRGELVFVTGDNGSGKTTLMKMLMGLYPTSGVIRWDGVIVSGARLARYRGLFTAIFNNQYLFDQLYGLEVPAERVRSSLMRFGIEEMVAWDGQRFASLDLSSGQRMRLAMVVALLEERPVCVFDEWTANQDPETTRFYYDTLLPELIAAGKTIIAVNHDERFVERADRVVRLESGRVVSE